MGSGPSGRVVDLLPTVVEVLRELKTKQDTMKRETGSAYADLILVFCQPDGKPLPWSSLREDCDRKG